MSEERKSVDDEFENSIGLNDFEVVGHAGKGGFGDVVKVRMK
jgi:hypothetical protein